MNVYTIKNLAKEQIDLHYVKEWGDKRHSVPIYHADTPHAFNRVIGYARYINATAGTVLYRGQNNLHSSLLPSGARSGKNPVSEKIFEEVCQENNFSKFFGLERPEIKGWKEYNYMLIEAVLQHYGASTFCMDFVDNHWCALWFGLYKFQNNHYHIRDDDGNLYVFLYVAETKGPCVGGMYIGDETYTVDLRKALPSTFQRPASQHGWVVRKKERKSSNLDNHVVGIIEVSVHDAQKWLGNGLLLSEENFFPSYKIDQGYKVLLARQHRSGLYLNKGHVLPQNTICNYHLHEMIYCSEFEKIFNVKRKEHSPKGISVENPMELFSILLDSAWDSTTCADSTKWNEEQPYIGQSAATSVLLQCLFGGDICFISYSSKTHYFNIVGNVVIDLTYSELDNTISKNCYNPANYTKIKDGIGNVHKKNREKVTRLIEALK